MATPTIGPPPSVEPVLPVEPKAEPVPVPVVPVAEDPKLLPPEEDPKPEGEVPPEDPSVLPVLPGLLPVEDPKLDPDDPKLLPLEDPKDDPEDPKLLPLEDPKDDPEDPNADPEVPEAEPVVVPDPKAAPATPVPPGETALAVSVCPKRPIGFTCAWPK
jgi:hypothetical protein